MVCLWLEMLEEGHAEQRVIFSNSGHRLLVRFCSAGTERLRIDIKERDGEQSFVS